MRIILRFLLLAVLVHTGKRYRLSHRYNLITIAFTSGLCCLGKLRKKGKGNNRGLLGTPAPTGDVVQSKSLTVLLSNKIREWAFMLQIYSARMCRLSRTHVSNTCNQPRHPSDLGNLPPAAAGDNPQTTCDSLSCNFESSCCWTNAQPPADQLNWVQATGQPAAANMQQNFKTESVPGIPLTCLISLQRA